MNGISDLSGASTASGDREEGVPGGTLFNDLGSSGATNTSEISTGSGTEGPSEEFSLSDRDGEITRILLIEDNPGDARLIMEYLSDVEGSRYVIDTKDRLSEGLAAMGQMGFDIVLLDLTLPDSSGIETFEKVVGADQSLPVIVLTGMEDGTLAVKAVAQGAQDYIQKGTISSGSLSKAIRYAIERKRLVQEAEEGNTRLTKALDELRTAQKSLVHQERIRALHNMASGIAHDFNNSLTPVLGFSELLLYDHERMSTEDIKRYLSLIQEGATNARHSVERLRAFYRRRTAQDGTVPFDLNALVREAVDATRPRWKNVALASGVHIRVREQLGEVPVISGNPLEIKEMITNLIINAVEAMPEGGEITIKTGAIRKDGKNMAELSVSDTGIGMLDEVRERCLEPFFTTKREVGAGLGLSMLCGLAHHGDCDVEIESELDLGTRITVRINTVEIDGSAAEGPTDGMDKAPDEPGPIEKEAADDSRFYLDLEGM